MSSADCERGQENKYTSLGSAAQEESGSAPCEVGEIKDRDNIRNHEARRPSSRNLACVVLPDHVCLIRLRLVGNNRDYIKSFIPALSLSHLAVRDFAFDRGRLTPERQHL